MFDYPCLEILRAVEREGTFERAARTLGITRSAISQKIRLLEERWGSAAISRKPVRATNLGKRLCEHIEQVCLLETNLLLRAGHLFDTSQIEPSAIKLMFDTELLQTGLLDNLTLFAENQIDFVFEITRNSSDEIHKAINPVSMMTAISGTRMEAPDFEIYHLGSQEFIAVAHPELFQSSSPSTLTAEHFSATPCITYGASSDLCAQLLSKMFVKPVSLDVRLLRSNSGILNACLRKKGWALVPRSSASALIRDNHLVELFPQEFLSVPIYFYVSKYVGDILPEVAKTVIEAAKQQLSSTG